MIIENVELRDIFKTASEEHLQNLEDGLLHLEKHPHDQARLEEVLREAHTLKRDSRMLGVDTVETLIHQLEESLGTVKRGEVIFSSEICDRLYQAIDAIRKLAHEAVTGEPANVNSYVLAQLTGANPNSFEPNFDWQTDSSFPDIAQAASELFNVDALFPDITTFPEFDPNTVTESADLFDVDALFPGIVTAPEIVSNQAEVELLPIFVPAAPSLEISAQLPQLAEVGELATNSNYQIDTIRVEPQKLDTLMTQAGELTVTKIRIAHRLAEIEEILTLWEEWSRDTFVNRLALDDIE